MISARSKTPLHRSRFRARGTPKPLRREPVSKEERCMRIGILGSGLMGGKLGTVWARAGHEVVFSYSRCKEKLNKVARDARGKARAGPPSEAAKDADVLLLAVHWSRIDDVLKQAPDLSDKVIVSCSLPMNAANTDLVIAHTSSVSEALARDVGFDPVDAGPLRIARYTEPFALVIGQLTYEGTGGPELAYRFE